jgi:hypothetical protein
MDVYFAMTPEILSCPKGKNLIGLTFNVLIEL